MEASHDDLSASNHTPTLAEVVVDFITKARDKHGMGRFMPDELPLLDEMARLARIELDTAARREYLEAARLARRHVVERGEIGFTYRPTPPSGPPPEDES